MFEEAWRKMPKRGPIVLSLTVLLAACGGTDPANRGVRWSDPYPYPRAGVWGGSAWPGSPWWGPERSRFGFPRRDWGDGGRTFRPDRNVVCDRATATCYRDGEIDASETRDYFGRGAARRVDRIRDRFGTNHIFRPQRDVVCDRKDRVCFKDGRPDRGETRDFFGRKAARKID